LPTHGSLTKAGKVRSQTPKVETTSTVGSHIPRVNMKNKYFKRIVNAKKNNWRRRR
jgi:small subunit ribosomal protein S30e